MLPSDLAAELRARTDEFRLAALHDTITAHATECLALTAEGADDYAALGNTRFGGDPDLPEGMPWPMSLGPDGETSLFSSFVGQVNLAELPRVATSADGPTSGILYLFMRSFDLEGIVWDVRYHAAGSEGLARRAMPDPDRAANELLADLEPTRVRAQRAISLAWYRDALRDAVLASRRDALRDYFAMEDSLRRPRQIGQWLGFASTGEDRQNLYRQTHLRSIGQGALNAADCWHSLAGYEASLAQARAGGNKPLADWWETMRPGLQWLLAHGDEIAAGAARWKLLLRLDTNHAMGLDVHDASSLFAFIRDEDLAAGHFDALPGHIA